jgi:hypothetical protein
MIEADPMLDRRAPSIVAKMVAAVVGQDPISKDLSATTTAISKTRCPFKLWRVVAPHFVAGLEVDQRGDLRNVAPIIGWAKRLNWNIYQFWAYCQDVNWAIEKIDSGGQDDDTVDRPRGVGG